MKDSCCTETESQTMAQFIRHAVKLVPVKVGDNLLKMPKEALHTAEYIPFKDELFDSINGQSINPDKSLRCVISKDSPHNEFWEDAKKKMKNMRFVNKNSK